MKYFKDFKSLCTPASVYLFINVIIFISIAVQNFGNTTKYCVGQYKCNVPNTFSMFLFKAVYMLFWTFILNAICKAGYKEVSWFMVLLPIILLFIIIGIVILNSGSVSLYEGFKEGASGASGDDDDDNATDDATGNATGNASANQEHSNTDNDQGNSGTTGTNKKTTNTQHDTQSDVKTRTNTV